MKDTERNTFLRAVKNVALHFLFPCRCVFCRRLMPVTTKIAVCHTCMQKLPFTMAYPRCGRCGRPMAVHRRYCAACDGRMDFAFERICVPYLYEGAVKKALILFKRERYQSFAKVFAAHIGAVLSHDLGDVCFDAVVSVPPRPERMRKEGYDQAETLAAAVAKQMELPYLGGGLYQSENRKKQSALSKRERRANVRGNYAVRKKNAVKGKCILLVDDITTTGATIQECARALRGAGAKAVYAAAAATVVKGEI